MKYLLKSPKQIRMACICFIQMKKNCARCEHHMCVPLAIFFVYIHPLVIRQNDKGYAHK